MSQAYKAQRRSLKLGTSTLNVFQLPDGSYCFSQSEVASVINKQARSIFEFLGSKRAKALLSESSEFSIFSGLVVDGSNKPISPISLEFAALYWQHWDHKGNPIAAALVNALLKRSLNELADEVFGVKKTPIERHRQLQADFSPESVARIAAVQQQLEVHQHLYLQMHQMMLQMQQLQMQLQIAKTSFSENQPMVFMLLNQAGDIQERVVGLPPEDLMRDLGIEEYDHFQKLLKEAGADLDSGYWRFATAKVPVLSQANYFKVKSLLVERLARHSEFQCDG